MCPTQSSKVENGNLNWNDQIYFRNDVPRSYQSYRRTKGTQFPQNFRATSNGRDITFDVVMDV